AQAPRTGPRHADEASPRDPAPDEALDRVVRNGASDGQEAQGPADARDEDKYPAQDELQLYPVPPASAASAPGPRAAACAGADAAGVMHADACSRGRQGAPRCA